MTNRKHDRDKLYHISWCLPHHWRVQRDDGNLVSETCSVGLWLHNRFASEWLADDAAAVKRAKELVKCS